jgi:hypothetical protein
MTYGDEQAEARRLRSILKEGEAMPVAPPVDPLLDVTDLVAEHQLFDGYCPTCNGGCLVGFGNPTMEHEAHLGDHKGYACGFSGPHCWACNEPWPCRAALQAERPTK